MKDKRRDSDEHMREDMQKKLSSDHNDAAADDRKHESPVGDSGAREEPRAGSTSTYS